jgi:hypothetical protein
MLGHKSYLFCAQAIAYFHGIVIADGHFLYTPKCLQRVSCTILHPTPAEVVAKTAQKTNLTFLQYLDLGMPHM